MSCIYVLQSDSYCSGKQTDLCSDLRMVIVLQYVPVEQAFPFVELLCSRHFLER